MYVIALNHFLDPIVVWLDQPPDPVDAARSNGQSLLTFSTPEEAREVVDHVLQLLDEGREAALIFQPSLVT